MTRIHRDQRGADSTELAVLTPVLIGFILLVGFERRSASTWACHPRLRPIHVARRFAAGLIEVRRRIQRVGDRGDRPVFEPTVFRSRYLKLTRWDHLSDAQAAARLGAVLRGRPELEAAWRMLQHL